MSLISKAPFIAVSGIIGVGKSTFTHQLSEHLGYDAIYEPVEENPYLEDFYKNIERWTFNMQMFLLATRFRQHQECLWRKNGVVLDRSIYEDTIFARMHRDDGLMDDRDWQTYSDHFHIMQGFLRYPDVIVYLRVQPDMAMERIRERNRSAEITIDMHYLERLYEGYEEFADEMNRYTVVVTLDWAEYQPVENMVGVLMGAAERKQKFLRSLRRI